MVQSVIEPSQEALKIKMRRLRLKEGDVIEVREQATIKAIQEVLKSPWEGPDNIVFVYAPKGLKVLPAVDAVRILGEIAAANSQVEKTK